MNYDQLKLLKVRLVTVFLAILVSLLLGSVSDSHAQQKDQEERKPVAEAPQIATRIESITLDKSGNGTVIEVKSDGMINDFKSSTIDSTPNLPARIIFDIINVKSPFKKEQIVKANTKWVSQIRHYSSADKVRIVLDTKNKYLKSFSAKPVPNGLLISVGPMETKTSEISSQPVIKKEPLVSAGKIAEKSVTSDIKPVSDVLKNKIVLTDSKSAWVNKIDFSSEDSGKSTITIGTTKPVEYNVIKVEERLLHLQLKNTNIPVNQRRPLITTRFNSAVDRITPVLKPVMKKTTIVAIELREAVPYVVDQSDNILKVHFEASSVLPKPEKEAALPEWKEVLASVPIEPVETKTVEPLTKQVAEAKKILLEPEKHTVLKVAEAKKTLLESGKQHTESQVAEAKKTILGSEKQYTGEKIALDFYDTDIKNVFRILQEVSGKNFAVDKSVTGKVTLSLEKPVPWDQVLDLVLKMNQLGMVYEGDIIRISPVEAIKKENELKQAEFDLFQKIRGQERVMEPMVVEYIPISYANAKTEILPHLLPLRTTTKDPLKPPGAAVEYRGSVGVDERQNIIIITDIAEVVKMAKEIVSKLDKVTPQVIIEARIVEASTNFSREIGTSWGGGIGVQPTSLIAGTYGDVSSIDDRVGVGPQNNFSSVGGTYGANTAINFPTTTGLTDMASIGFNFVKLGGTPLLLNAKLQAMEAQGEGKIVSAPKIVTLDNKKATISQGLDYPYYKLDTSGNTTLEFKEVNLLLNVTPHVTADNRISMVIEIKKDDLGQIISGVQSFTTKEAKTELLMNDGETVVIGGIIKTTNSSAGAGVPGLSMIPILGWLFKTDGKTDNKEELLIFITPKIVMLERQSAQRSASLN
ncbi:MAG: type IV pilus secretin family protein [Desulfobacteraceae bacterium]|nr:MAG: type IV pilus secretin family protein [Desulfobacteraceae bacterium]